MSSPSVLVCLRCAAAIKTNSYKIKCNKCKLWCHRDCANLSIEQLQIFNKENNLESGKKWQCLECNKKPEESKKGHISLPQLSDNEIIIQENTYLKLLLKEMEEKNSLLKQNKQLLEQKVADLEYRLEKTSDGHANDKKAMPSRSLGTTVHVSAIDTQATLAYSNSPVPNTPIKSNFTYSEVLQNPNKSQRQNTHIPRSEKSARSARKRKQINIGTASIENADTDFTGKEDNNKKAWLFISRIKDHVTEQKIVDYIKQKTDITNDEDVVVKKIKTKYDSIRNDCQCFQVGIRFDMKEKVYEESFWPQKVSFRRYDFDINKRTGENQDF